MVCIQNGGSIKDVYINTWHIAGNSKGTNCRFRNIKYFHSILNQRVLKRKDRETERQRERERDRERERERKREREKERKRKREREIERGIRKKMLLTNYQSNQNFKN